MGLGPIIVVVVLILVISAVVGAIAQFMNKVNEANVVNRRPILPPPRAEGGGGAAPARPVDRDMDRFLAEIDRLRRKNANAPPETPRNAPAAPVVQPAKPVERPRPRVVAEMAEPRPVPTSFTTAHPAFPSGPSQAFPTAPPPPPGGEVTRLGDLPVAMIVTPPAGSTGAPATRVTAPARRAVPAPKTDFGKAFAALLGTGKGAALAVVLTEVMGPPKAKKRGS